MKVLEVLKQLFIDELGVDVQKNVKSRKKPLVEARFMFYTLAVDIGIHYFLICKFLRKTRYFKYHATENHYNFLKHDNIYQQKFEYIKQRWKIRLEDINEEEIIKARNYRKIKLFYKLKRELRNVLWTEK